MVCIFISAYGMYAYGMYAYDMYAYGMYAYGMYPYGMYPYGMYPYGMYPYGMYAIVELAFQILAWMNLYEPLHWKSNLIFNNLHPLIRLYQNSLGLEMTGHGRTKTW